MCGLQLKSDLCIDIVTNSEDEFTAGPVHPAVGKAHDGAAPPSVVRRGRSVDGMEQDQQEALCLVVCPQPMQGGLPSVNSRGGPGQGLGMSPGWSWRRRSTLPLLSWPGRYSW